MFFDLCVQTVKSDTVVRYNERKRQISGLETFSFIYDRRYNCIV